MYLKYVLRHKWYVFVECCKTGDFWRGFMHDMSKFLPSEWNAYAEYFYGKELTVTPLMRDYRKDKFDKAWLKHLHRNPHHWQYWMLQNDSDGLELLEMPEDYMREMLADWRGASRAIKGFDDTVNWYIANKDKMQLHLGTRVWIELQLGVD